MVSFHVIVLGVFIFILFLFYFFILFYLFLYFGGVFNKTIIPLALVGYEMIIANEARGFFTYKAAAVDFFKHSVRLPIRS
jgi:hypothetical protein